MSENENPSEMSLLTKSDTIPPGTIIQLQPGEEVWNFPEQLTAAVGRMRRLMAGEPRQLVYVSERRYELDKAVLSDAYLAEHPADDAEPVSVEWLLAEGFYETTILYRFELWHPGAYRATICYCSTRNKVGICTDPAGSFPAYLDGISTRGDVRRLRTLLERRAR